MANVGASSSSSSPAHGPSALRIRSTRRTLPLFPSHPRIAALTLPPSFTHETHIPVPRREWRARPPRPRRSIPSKRRPRPRHPATRPAFQSRLGRRCVLCRSPTRHRRSGPCRPQARAARAGQSGPTRRWETRLEVARNQELMSGERRLRWWGRQAWSSRTPSAGS